MDLSFNVTLPIVGAFMIITLLVGLYAGRKVKTIQDYVLGDRNLSTFSLTLTFIATLIGGGTILGGVDASHSDGLIHSITSASYGLNYILFAFVLGPRFIKFKDALSLGDIMGRIYGPKMKVFSGILGTIFTLIITAMQLGALGTLFSTIFDIPQSTAILSSGLVLGLYSSIGGIRSVAITDVLQFIVLFLAIPVLAAIVLDHVGGYKEVLSNLPVAKTQIIEHHHNYLALTYFFLLGIIPLGIIEPPLVQRMLMSTSARQSKNKFLSVGVLYTVITIVVSIIGLSSIIMFPDTDSKGILLKIINTLITNSWLKGFVYSGLIAVIMSTADSWMHSAGISLSHDVLVPVLYRERSSLNQVFLARVSTLLIVCLSIAIALQAKYFATLHVWAYKICPPILFAPMFLGVMGLKGGNKSLISGISMGVLSFLFFNYYLPPNINIVSIPIAIAFNFITMVLWHIYENRGIAWIKYDEEDKKKKEGVWVPTIEWAFNLIGRCVPTPSKLYSYSKVSVMKYGTNNILFGIFVCVNFTLPYFLWGHENKEIFDFLTNLRFIGGIMAGLLIVKSEWKDMFKPYFHIFWHFTLFYCLPFITTLMVLLSNGSVEWMVNVSVSIFFLILLASGGMFVILLPAGIAAGLLVYKLKFGDINLGSYGFEFNFNLFYVLFFSTVIALLFAYRKRLFYLIRGNQGMNLGGALAHELKNCGFQALPTAQLVSQYATMGGSEVEIGGEEGVFIKKGIYQKIKEFADETAHHMQQTIDISKGFERIFEEFKDSIANPMVISARLVVEKAIKEYVFADENEKKGVKLRLKDDFYAKIPKEAFSYVLSNIIRNAYKHGDATEIKIWLEHHNIHIRDNGKGIAPEHINNIFDLYYTTGDTKSTGRGLAFCKQIVDSCYGEISVNTKTEGAGTYTEFIIKLPSVSSSEIDEINLIDSENEGVSKGKDLKARQMAESMLRDSESVEKVKKYTDLSVAEIQDIRRELGT